MATPPTTDGAAVVELDEEIDGDEIGSRNYRFSKIGGPVPINSEFDPSCLPSQPLAVSERLRLLFVAYPQGFYVVRTKDVIATAEEIKEKQTGPSIKELCLLDVPIGKVSILALSADDSLLAVSVDSHVHFFAVSALLYKEQKPSYSVLLNDSSCIKDLRWAKKVAKAYLILSANGKLYHGFGQGPLACVMEGVDSVDWSVKGNFAAVAKKNTVSILSLQFKEKLKFLLPFGDSDANQVTKVDSIRWIRPDCIAVGCFQLNDDGEEENYLVQVITSKGGRLTDAASKPTVLSFSNVFMDFCSDAVPTRNGPHLFLSYLDLYGLAFIANRNLSIRVGLFCWVADSGKNEAAMVEILNDAWNLYIDSQDNGEENVIVGLSVDKVSQNENVRFTLGDEETEVSPCCVIICLTIDGKISVFHFASAAGALVSPESYASDEENDDSSLPLISSTGGEESREPTFSTPESHKLTRFEIEKTGAKATITNDSSASINVGIKTQEQSTTENIGQKPLADSCTVKVNEPVKALPLGLNQDRNTENQSSSQVKHSTNDSSASINVGIKTQEQSTTENIGQKPLADSCTVKVNEPVKALPLGLNQDRNTENQSSSQVKHSTNDSSDFINVGVKTREQSTTENIGQKPLADSRTVRVDETVKALPLTLNQDRNTDNQSSSQVKYSTGFFPEKVIGDISRQSITKGPLSSNVEPLRESPSTSSPSLWSLTRSTARDDASKTSDGRFSLLPFDVDNSDKHVRSAGHVLRHPTDINEKVKPSVTFTSFGQTTAQGHRNPLPAYSGSQVPLGESFPSGKPFQSEFKKDLNSSSSPGFPYSLQNSSKHFGNVEEMAKKMDILLEGIEGKGGFLDASISSQTKSVVELEDGIWALSGRCRTWKGLLNEQLRELQLLLDKTVQVLVRKVYMEGVFKQATDSRYWELWNSQKLSSELELKRRRILELNQELTNKLIELERHFNSLEFSKFGENGGMQRNQRALQNRQTPSLHSLHNTMQAQLAAAEQLSGCLSNQMAALRIGSSEKQDIKKQLFESIGLSYIGDNERSPARNRTSNTPLNKEHLITSSSVASKEHSRRDQTSFAKSPETARRRRDSLDRSWASFEPPKTTVKRMLKEDYDQGNANRSFLNIDKQYLSPQSQKSEVARSANSNIFRASLNSYKSKGTAEIPEQHTESPITSLHQRTAGSLDNGIQVLSTKSYFASRPSSILQTGTAQNSQQAAFKLIDEKSKSSLQFTGKRDSFAAGESSFVHKKSDTSVHPLPSISTPLPEQSLTSPSVSTESLVHFKIGFNKPATGDQKKSTWIVSDTPLFDSKIPVNPESAFSSGTNISEKGSCTKVSEKPSRDSDNSTASIPPQSVFGSSLFSSDNVPSFASSVSKPSSSTSFPATPSRSVATVAAEEASQLMKAVPSTLNFASASPLLIRENNLSSISPSSSPSQSPVAMLGSKTEGVSLTRTSGDDTSPKTEKDVKIQASVSQPGFTISSSDLKAGPSMSSATTELSTSSKFGSQIDSGGLSKSSSVTSTNNTELSTATVSLSPVAQSSEGIIGSVKNDTSNSSYEEEMEEEAPETDQTTELSLGNLSGFGIGSSPNLTTPKSNPFGVTMLNKNTTFASSPNMMSAPSGELFRPASFNFQPPQPSPQPSQPTNVNFSGGFSSANSGQVSAVSGFGQPANMGSGQQALGSVLGTFGQSRQLGAGLPGNNVAPANAFGSGFRGISPGGFGVGFAPASSAGGFASLATGGGGFAPAAGGGFAAAATAGDGFAAAATAGGGFAAAATAGGGFAAAATAGVGFAAAAPPTFGSAASNPGGGFGAFGNQQGGGGGGFSGFGSGGGSAVGRPPSELFTQMRK